MEGEPKTDETLPDLKETVAFRQVLSVVGEAFQDWYRIESEELPALNPQLIVFLTEEKFNQEKDNISHLEANLLVRALLIAGAKKEELFVPYQGSTPIFTRSFHSPRYIYVNQRQFLDLTFQDRVQRDATAIRLGVHLTEMNLILLQSPSEIKDMEVDGKLFWQTQLRKQIQLFFDENSFRIPPERQEELTKAKELFDYFLNNDPSLRLIARGSEVLAMMKQDGEERPLIGLGSRFNSKVAFSLGERVKRRLISRLAEKNSMLNASYFLNLLEATHKNEQIREVEDFLSHLKLGSYTDCFSAYRESRIPQIYLERLKVRRGKLPRYPMD